MKILCIGSALADITSWPVDTELLATRHLCPEKIVIGPGGCAGNCCLGLASLGQDVELIARLGDDHTGSLVRDAFEKGGVKIGKLQTDPDKPTGVTIVLVDGDGERRFIYTAGANAFLEPMPDLDLTAYDLVHISDVFLLELLLGKPMIQLLSRARAAGCKTSLDTVWDPAGRWMDSLEEMLPLLDFLFASEEETDHLLPGVNPQDTVTAFRERGVDVVILKRGENGCLIGYEDQMLSIVPPTVKPMDSTGAGDAFVAGFLAAIAEGQSIPDAGRAATDFAVYSLSFLGATSGFERLPSVVEFCRLNASRSGLPDRDAHFGQAGRQTI